MRRGIQASRWQVLSPAQGWPPTMLASGLALQAGSSLLMGEGNTVSDCTNPLRSIRLSKYKVGGHMRPCLTPELQARGWMAGSFSQPRKDPALERLRKGELRSSWRLKTLPFWKGPLCTLWTLGFWPQILSTINSNCPAFCRAPRLQVRERARMKGHWEMVQFLLSFPRGQDWREAYWILSRRRWGWCWEVLPASLPRPHSAQFNSGAGHLAPPGVKTEGALPSRAEPPGLSSARRKMEAPPSPAFSARKAASL